MSEAAVPTPSILLTVAYDGSLFHGFAPQAGMRTVASVLSGALGVIDPHSSPIRAASRTDAGVHAEGQLVAFDSLRDLPPKSWVLALNSNLPDDVAVCRAELVECGFHPRFSATQKRYRYRLWLEGVRHPFWGKRAWQVNWPLDKKKLEREARLIEGEHDFAAFRSIRDGRENTIRTIASVHIEQDNNLLSISVTGNAFMYNMVRILVGTLVDVARGKLPEQTVTRAFASKNRRDVGITAPAHGLTLEQIECDSKIALATWP